MPSMSTRLAATRPACGTRAAAPKSWLFAPLKRVDHLGDKRMTHDVAA